jgi:hypothetical protein
VYVALVENDVELPPLTTEVETKYELPKLLITAG